MSKEMIHPNFVKSRAEIDKMILFIQNAIDITPKTDNWENSNCRDICEMKSHIRDLNGFIKTGKVDKWTETRLWLEGDKNNFLEDFVV